MTEKKVCNMCKNSGIVMASNGKNARCPNCGGRGLMAAPKVVGYKAAKPVVKKVKPVEEITRDWK